jgi:alkanesulfonate monooxygenase SsuD/methylene tetrahydromethanopterin reductase-like flavin-dependent oxidoreductase (luciferase family)
VIQLSVPLRSYAVTDPGGWEHVIRQAETLDQAGVDRLAVSDHVVFGENLDAYGRPEVGGQAGAKQPTGPDGHWLEPMTLLSVLAGRTSRIRLATNVLLAALRRPVVLAKSAATRDVLSGGRLDLGVGSDGSGRSTRLPAWTSPAAVKRWTTRWPSAKPSGRSAARKSPHRG